MDEKILEEFLNEVPKLKSLSVDVYSNNLTGDALRNSKHAFKKLDIGFRITLQNLIEVEVFYSIAIPSFCEPT